MFSLAFLIAFLSEVEPKPVATPPRPSPAEFGHGLSSKEAAAGWISLFDGTTDFGWKGATASNGTLLNGESTTVFSRYDLIAEVTHAGILDFGGKQVPVSPGKFEYQIISGKAGPIRLLNDAAVSKLVILPRGLRQLFNGRDLSNATILRHPKLPAETQQASWSIEAGAIHAVGGPGAVEFPERFGDMVLQIDVRTRKELANGGVFIRSVPGQFMNGYEAQVYNACYDGDPLRTAKWSTGAIDDRQMARRLVSRDNETFTMTVIAVGTHFSTWINGWQMTDWTDTREPHDNPRQGLRTDRGTIQLQAHDPQTDVEFKNIRVADVP